jgi:hypothetical protein
VSRTATVAVAVTAGTGAALYGAFVRAAFDGTELGHWDLALQILQDRQLYTLVLLPAWIAGCLVDLRFLDRRAVRIRLGSRRALWGRAMRNGLGRVAPTLLAMNLGAAMAAWGLPLAARAPEGFVTAAYRSSGLVPLAAWAGSMAVLTLGLLVVCGAVAAVGAAFGARWATPIGIGFWAFVLASFQFGWPARPILEPLIAIGPMLDEPSLSWRAPLWAAALLCGSLAVVLGLEWWTRGGRPADLGASTWVGSAAVGVAGLAVLRVELLGLSSEAAVVEAFFGPGGSVLQRLTALILVAGVAAARAFAVLARADGLAMARRIRHGTAAREYLAELRGSARPVGIVALGVFVAGALVLLLGDAPEEPVRVGGLLLAVVASGAATTMLVCAILLTVVTLSPTPVALAGAITAVVALIWLFPATLWNPLALFGAWSVIDGRSAWATAAVLAVAFAVLALIGVAIIRWRRT